MNAVHPLTLPAASTVADLAHRRLADNTRSRVMWTQEAFAGWATAQGLPCLPTTEQTIIRWLHTQIGHLAPLTMRGYADGVRTAHVLAGHPDPGGPRLSAYLVAVRREAAEAGTLRRPRVTAVDLLEVVDRVDATPSRTDPGGRLLELRARAALLLGRAAAAPLRQLVLVDLATVVLDGPDLAVRLPATAMDPSRRVHLVQAPGDPLCAVTAVAEYLRHLPTGTTRLFGFVMRPPGPGRAPEPVPEDMPAPRGHRTIERSLQRAARRAGLSLKVAPYPSAGMAPGELEWLLPFLNWQVLVQLRNRAYVLLGVAHARRADELNRLTVGDLLEQPGGLDVLVASSKTDGDGEGTLLPLQHEEDDPTGGCVNHCPIGALERWTQTMSRLWDVSATDPLFPSMRAGQAVPTGKLTTADGSRILRQVLGRDDVSSRTMRASTITALRAENEPLERIATVSRHASLEQLARYLRILDPHEDQYHLPV